MYNSIFALLLFTAMMLLALHNIIKYLFVLKVKKKLIVMFYVTTFATALLAIFLCAAALFQPSKVYENRAYIGDVDISILFIIDDMLALSCGLTVFLTLQKLSITI